MAKCATCNSTILFGAKRHNGLEFCNDKCLRSGVLFPVLNNIPEDVVNEAVRNVHEGACPKCEGRGPVDIHTSHSIWSLFIMTQWKSTPRMLCRSCGIKSQLWEAFTAAIVGWWGVPWGIFGTPIQIARNIGGVIKGPDPLVPSEELKRVIGLNMASNIVQQQRSQNQS